MPAGCTNPKAINYNPAADSDDGTCVYLSKVGGICYQFADVPQNQLLNRSFTLSYSAEGSNWVFYHDYIPDYYIQTREKLYNLWNNRIFSHNTGPFGVYHDGQPKSFFIDAVFRSDSEMTLNTIEWISEVFNINGQPLEQKTLTHITIWNSFQCTGRIALADQYENLEFKNKRRTMAQWSFDNFRNELRERGIVFLQDLFNNFAVIPGSLDANKTWYERDLMEDEFFCVRLEFDNTENTSLILHDADISADKSYR